jgi:tetratricopeptide (TPR) repeat protein
MTRLRLLAVLTPVLAMTVLGLTLGGVPAAEAQTAPVPPTGPTFSGGTPAVGDAEGPRGGGNYDYFTANLRPDLGRYLSQVTARHASERVWAVFRAGRYSEPLGDCKYALERFPNHPRALHLIGEIAKVTNEVTMEIPYLEYALQLDPQYAFTHAQYGHYLIDIGAVPAGIGQLREALRIDPTQFQAKAWLAEAMAKNPELAKEAPAPAATAPPRPSGGSTPAPRPTNPPGKR